MDTFYQKSHGDRADLNIFKASTGSTGIPRSEPSQLGGSNGFTAIPGPHDIGILPTPPSSQFPSPLIVDLPTDSVYLTPPLKPYTNGLGIPFPSTDSGPHIDYAPALKPHPIRAVSTHFDPRSNSPQACGNLGTPTASKHHGAQIDWKSKQFGLVVKDDARHLNADFQESSPVTSADSKYVQGSQIEALGVTFEPCELPYRNRSPLNLSPHTPIDTSGRRQAAGVPQILIRRGITHPGQLLIPGMSLGSTSSTVRCISYTEHENDSSQEMTVEPETRLISRSPSPWQSMDNPNQEQLLVQSLLWSFSITGDEVSSPHESASSNQECVPTDTSLADFSQGLTHRSYGSTTSSLSGAGRGSQGTVLDFSGGSTLPGHLKRPLRPNDSNDGGKDEDDPGSKKQCPSTPQHLGTLPRFACPYQKYDPLGSPFCCWPNSRNREGGVDTITRLKSHISRNHDPSKRCSNCWRRYEKNEDPEEHRAASKCTQRPSPSKYWMSIEQQNLVGQRMMSGNRIESWFSLFEILLPHIPREGPNGYRRTYSPYYVAPQQAPLTPATSSAGSGHPSIMARLSSGLTESPPSAERLNETPAVSQLSPPDAESQSLSEFLLSHDLDFPGWVDDVQSQEQTTLIAPRLSIPPPDFASSTGPMTQSNDFLQQDNRRLFARNSQLRDEVSTLARERGELTVQLNELQERLRSLDGSLQDLLYLPSVRGAQGGEKGDENIASRLFGMLELVTATRRL